MKKICLLGYIVLIVSCQQSIVVNDKLKENFIENSEKIDEWFYFNEIDSMKISDSIKLDMHRRISKMDMNFEALEFYLLESYTNAPNYPKVSDEFYYIINSINRNIKDNDLCDCKYVPEKLRNEIDFEDDEVRFKQFEEEMKSFPLKKQKLFECVMNYRPLKAHKNKPIDDETRVMAKKYFNIDI
jgi:hypothetical protein